MANLSAAELLKPGREYRTAVIIRKMNDGEKFELSNGKTVQFKNSKQIIDILKTNNAAAINSIKFLGIDDKIYKLSDIKKNAEFGGKGDRAGVIKEDMALKSLNDQLNSIKKNISKSFVPMNINGKIHKVIRAESTSGTPKSDFHLIDIDGKECVWISHKDGKSPKDFQQWGGISQRIEPLIFGHPETQKFIKDLKAIYPKGLPSATSLRRKIKDKKLKMLSVYGNKFGSMLGQQNVSILLQGNVEVISAGSEYKLKANHVHYNGESVDGNGFDPSLLAVFKGDRSDAGIKGTRITIAPYDGRKAEDF